MSSLKGLRNDREHGQTFLTSSHTPLLRTLLQRTTSAYCLFFCIVQDDAARKVKSKTKSSAGEGGLHSSKVEKAMSLEAYNDYMKSQPTGDAFALVSHFAMHICLVKEQESDPLHVAMHLASAVPHAAV